MIQACRRGGRGNQAGSRELNVRACPKVPDSRGELFAGKPRPRKWASENPQARSGVTQVRIPGLLDRRADCGHDAWRGQNRQFGDLRHSVAVRLALT
jgi:hypothetical protein